MEIPYTTQVRHDTGLYNGKLGMWLFLASEIMLFGGLFSAYVFVRVGSGSWPSGAEVLNVPLATLNTVILILSSMTMVMAWAGFAMNNPARGQRFLAATIVLGTVFMLVKFYEYSDKFSHGIGPATDNFYGIYFVLTGLHLVHIVGGLVVLSFHLVFGGKMRKNEPLRYTNRIEVTGLYWHFVDMVWLILFPALYLT